MTLSRYGEKRLPLYHPAPPPERYVLENGECVMAWVARRPDGSSREEIGELMGISHTHVANIERAALGKLKGSPVPRDGNQVARRRRASLQMREGIEDDEPETVESEMTEDDREFCDRMWAIYSRPREWRLADEDPEAA